MATLRDNLRATLAEYGQDHVLRFWDSLNERERELLAGQVQAIDFPLVSRLVRTWVLNAPEPEAFERIEPVRVIPFSTDTAGAREVLEAGEEALRAGRIGLVLVAGGQGTRLGFDAPKGAFPIGPVSGRSLFAFHAEKIHNLQRRYGCTFAWYIMVGQANAAETETFFRKNAYFGLDSKDITFFQQDMMPCVDDRGKFLLQTPHQLAMNPNGHGGCIPALVKNGLLRDARARGIDTLSYFQVDNWAVRAADPRFIGHHLLRRGAMSSKFHRKQTPRAPSGVFCSCDGQDRVIEYTEFDIYPQLLEQDSTGALIHFAANAAIHLFSVDFLERTEEKFNQFPWHCSHKKIPFLDPEGNRVEPEQPNGYKFESFVFDALRFCPGGQAVMEVAPEGEFTPTKQLTGPGSVELTQRKMARYWAGWLEAAGCPISRNPDGFPAVDIEISPQFALDPEEFIQKTAGWQWPQQGPIAIGPEGERLPAGRKLNGFRVDPDRDTQ